MTEYHTGNHLKLTPAEELTNRQMTAMREVVRAAYASKPQSQPSPIPAYMQGAVRMTALAVWATSGRLGVVKQALLAGAKVNDADEVGMTPLHYAVLAAEIRVVQLLLNLGADVEVKSARGETPIDLAVAARVAAVQLWVHRLFYKLCAGFNHIQFAFVWRKGQPVRPIKIVRHYS